MTFKLPSEDERLAVSMSTTEKRQRQIKFWKVQGKEEDLSF